MGRSRLIASMAVAFRTPPGQVKSAIVPDQELKKRAEAALKEVERYLGCKIDEAKARLEGGDEEGSDEEGSDEDE